MQFSNTLNSLKKLLFIYLFFLGCMTLFRGFFFSYYAAFDSYDAIYWEILEAFFLGFRIDLTVIGYIQILPSILLIALYFSKNKTLLDYFHKFLLWYLFVCFTIIVTLLGMDFGFYSYFKDHINVIFFGLFDDDTKALIITFWQNYNVVAIFALFALILLAAFKVIQKILNLQERTIEHFFRVKNPIILFTALILVNFLAIRGTLGMYPLSRMIPNLSTHEFINKLPQNGVRAFVAAYGHRQKYLNAEYDLIAATGFKGNMAKAFEIHTQSTLKESQNLLQNITYKTNDINKEPYNVVVIMVESFGMPILNYQSDSFDIMGKLKNHFQEDTLFTNIISDGDGTISSLQSLLLSIPHRPNSFELSQSLYKQTPFKHSAAFVFNAAEYETSFIYGGDLTWRNLGDFLYYQGYKNVEGKIDISKSLDQNTEEEDLFHPWGIFDEHLYTHILKKLETSTQKQFIVALSTNNHPPYNLPKQYQSKSLIMNDRLKKHITGDLELAQQRFASFAYALDQVGIFLEKFKESSFKENTIVVITADNNTVDGIMSYENNALLNSKNIPLYIYLPQKLKEKLTIDTHVAGSQKDIFPTLYNLTLPNASYTSVGTDLLNPQQPHYGMNGSMIINHDNEIKKLQQLNDSKEDPLLLYYRASLAVTEYLINSYAKK